MDWKRELDRSGKLAEVTDERSRAFDMAYADERAYTIKFMFNIESFGSEQAEILKKCAYVVDAEPLVISERGKENLKGGVVYKRYGVPVMRGDTFARILRGERFAVATRGGVKVPVKNVQEAREETGMSRTTLAKLLGVSTEMVRKYECGDADPGEEVAERLLEIFGDTVLKDLHPEVEQIKRAFIGKSPFDLAVRKKHTVLISFNDSPERIKNLQGVSEVLEAEPVVTDSLEDVDLE